MHPDYVTIEDEEPVTVRYESAPPVSAVRLSLRDNTPTLRSSMPPPEPRKWPVHIARFVAATVLVALSLDLPALSTLVVLGSTLILVLLARHA